MNFLSEATDNQPAFMAIDLNRNQYFDTFSATIQHYGKYSCVSIDRLSSCCTHVETIQRNICSDASWLYDDAVRITRELNATSMLNFLRHRRRSITLTSIFQIADKMGVILTRPLFQSAVSDSLHPFHRFPRVMKLSPDRFIDCCRILQKYGALYAINDEQFVSSARGIS